MTLLAMRNAAIVAAKDLPAAILVFAPILSPWRLIRQTLPVRPSNWHLAPMLVRQAPAPRRRVRRCAHGVGQTARCEAGPDHRYAWHPPLARAGRGRGLIGRGNQRRAHARGSSCGSHGLAAQSGLDRSGSTPDRTASSNSRLSRAIACAASGRRSARAACTRSQDAGRIPERYCAAARCPRHFEKSRYVE